MSFSTNRNPLHTKKNNNKKTKDNPRSGAGIMKDEPEISYHNRKQKMLPNMSKGFRR